MGQYAELQEHNANFY